MNESMTIEKALEIIKEDALYNPEVAYNLGKWLRELEMYRNNINLLIEDIKGDIEFSRECDDLDYTAAFAMALRSIRKYLRGGLNDNI